MSSAAPTAYRGVPRNARAAVSALFFINAVLYANLLPRYPEVKERLGLSNASLGAALAAFPLGALLAGLFAAVLIRRFGSAKVASLGLIVLAAVLLTVPVAANWLTLAAAMLVAGGLDAVVDVAQNAHGFRVQRLYRRSIVNAFHGVWSIGAVVGGLMGSAAAGLRVPLTAHLATSAVVFGALALICYRYLLPGPEDAERATGDLDDENTAAAATYRRLRAIPRAALLLLGALGVLAACGAFVEDAGASWGALYLRSDLAASAATGGFAFVALQVAMTTGRLTGDRVVDRYGQRNVALAGGGLIAVGMGFALAVPSIATTLLGFALAGLGVATLIPAVMHTADELPGLPPGVGLTIVSWLLRAGFLLSPPLVGLVADATSLRVALLSVVLAGTGVLLLGRVLVNQTTSTTTLTDTNDPLRP
jgi:MFS family permease